MSRDKPAYVLITSPGLPPWPKLYFDPKSRQAKCTARIASWKSHMRARTCSVYLVWTFIGMVLGILWLNLRAFSWVEQLLILVPVGYVLTPITKYLIFQVMPEFLARQLFARRVKFWFSAEAIAFKSSIYLKPIIVWRRWRDLPVRGQFIVEADHEAANFLQEHHNSFETPVQQLNEAAVLALVITMARKDAGLKSGAQQNLLRKLPVVEINTHQATNLSIVCGAAIGLVSSSFTTHRSDGTDLDADPSQGDE